MQRVARMFTSPYIKINEHGIDLIKDYQTTRHIEFSAVKQIIYQRGYLINNWILTLILGVTLAISTFIWEIKSINNFNLNSIPLESRRAYLIIKIIVPCLLFISAVILIFLSFRKSPVIKILTHQNKYRIALKEFEKNNQIDSLIQFLDERVNIVKH